MAGKKRRGAGHKRKAGGKDSQVHEQQADSVLGEAVVAAAEAVEEGNGGGSTPAPGFEAPLMDLIEKKLGHQVEGTASDGSASYSSIHELWEREAGADPSGGSAADSGRREAWYDKGAHYWKDIEATNNGVLGGLEFVGSTDCRDSLVLLDSLLMGKFGIVVGNRRALDCGAGIGRVSLEVLSKKFQTVDLVEQDEKFLSKARDALRGCSWAGDFFCEGLQNFAPAAKHYDVIWVQWVACCLTDEDLVSFLQRCKVGLVAAGVVVVKENTLFPGDGEATSAFLVDKNDTSVTRSNEYFLALWEAAGFDLIANRQQRKFPKDLMPVRMWILRPR